MVCVIASMREGATRSDARARIILGGRGVAQRQHCTIMRLPWIACTRMAGAATISSARYFEGGAGL